MWTPSPIPAPYICLDIETGHDSDEAIDALMAEWEPPGNVSKPETIEAKRVEAREKLVDKSALNDSAPILCVAMRSPFGALVVNGMTDEVATDLPGWEMESPGNERDMLVAVRSWLDLSTDPSTVLVGHNVKGFDLPKLRVAYLRHRLTMPMCLRPVDRANPEDRNQTVYDTMREYTTYYHARGDMYVSLAKVCLALGLESPKSLMSGAQVPSMHAEGGHALEICTYCCVDVASEERVYRLMTGLEVMA